MIPVIEAFILAMVVLLIGLPVILFRRKKVMAIVASGDLNKIPKSRKAKYEKNGIRGNAQMKQFEKENMNFAMKHPLAYSLLIFVFVFIVFIIQRSM